MAKPKSRREKRIEALQEALTAGTHPLLSALPSLIIDFEGRFGPPAHDAWLDVIAELPDTHYRYPTETIRLIVRPNLNRDSEPTDWRWLIARVRLHCALNHIDPERPDLEWSVACWAAAEALLVSFGLGSRPHWLPPLLEGYKLTDERALAERLREEARIPDALLDLGLGSPAQPFWRFRNFTTLTDKMRREATRAFARGVRAAAVHAVQGAGLTQARAAAKDSEAEQARAWFIASYPLLASLAACFTLVVDAEVCERLGIHVAAVNSEIREIYVNPKVHLTAEEVRFVMAHEILHVGLRHERRRQGRDPWLWNVACDYVVNGWLLEMGVGHPPESVGYLHDPDLKGASAEEVYDRITGDLRILRKLKKLRGWGRDMLSDAPEAWWSGAGADLDAFYRRALLAGLDLHQESGRGLLPAGLVEEIKSLNHPPIPWDVSLGNWLDSFFDPPQTRRTFARASRRQEASPDIPRPGRAYPLDTTPERTFGVVLDSSGSMDRITLGCALGAIRSYALSREVRALRLVQCDAAAHDSGYVAPDDLLNAFEVHGRGGTILMPGVRLLELATDFPASAPILVITDGQCDQLLIRRPHAYLVPFHGTRPRAVQGPIFRMQERLVAS
jgi:predicted metal-dependent peptidase